MTYNCRSFYTGRGLRASLSYSKLCDVALNTAPTFNFPLELKFGAITVTINFQTSYGAYRTRQWTYRKLPILSQTLEKNINKYQIQISDINIFFKITPPAGKNPRLMCPPPISQSDYGSAHLTHLQTCHWPIIWWEK